MGESNNATFESVCILEKDTSGDILIVWTFPAMEEDIEQVLISRSNLSQDSLSLPFSFSKYKNQWVYIHTQQVVEREGEGEGEEERKGEVPGNLRKVAVFSICLLRNAFNPEKYLALTKLMTSLYSATGDPAKVMQCQLSVAMRGVFDGGEAHGKFLDADFDNRRAYLVSSLKDIVRLFGEEIILLWIAVFTKKRVVVQCDKLAVLLKIIRGLPLLVWHRQNWSLLRPYVTITQNEIADLESAGVYIAGFTDPAIKAQEQLYDLFVDINSRNTYVPSHAKDSFVLGSFHQEIATFLVSSAEDNNLVDQTFIKNLAVKTKEILTKLESLRVEDPSDGKQYITMESLQQRKLPRGMDRFLFAVASAEGLTKNG